MNNRQHLRKLLRERRCALSPIQQQQAAQRLLQLLSRQPVFIRSRHIAFYLPNDGEIDPRPLIYEAWKQGKKCYLPILSSQRNNLLQFFSYTPSTELKPNRFNIPEPVSQGRPYGAHQLDLALLPLVGFDCEGGRMGMGGGFYDRTFAFKLEQPHSKPQLLGLAHRCQQVDSLPLESWDIPLNAIVSDEKIFVPTGASTGRDFLL